MNHNKTSTSNAIIQSNNHYYELLDKNHKSNLERRSKRSKLWKDYLYFNNFVCYIIIKTAIDVKTEYFVMFWCICIVCQTFYLSKHLVLTFVGSLVPKEK